MLHTVEAADGHAWTLTLYLFRYLCTAESINTFERGAMSKMTTTEKLQLKNIHHSIEDNKSSGILQQQQQKKKGEW